MPYTKALRVTRVVHSTGLVGLDTHQRVFLLQGFRMVQGDPPPDGMMVPL